LSRFLNHLWHGEAVVPETVSSAPGASELPQPAGE
jgi:hypothetical protein